MATGQIYKEKGNAQFKEGHYKDAEQLFTQAITKEPSNPFYYTNRAFTRLRLQAWDGVVDDCLTSIAQKPTLKAYVYLAEAKLALHQPNEALNSAITAYDLCLQSKTNSFAGATSPKSIVALILKAKKERWERREKERLRRRGELVAELEERLWTARDVELVAIQLRKDAGTLETVGAEEENAIVEELSRHKVDEVKNAFAISHPDQNARRDVPDYLVDSITFVIMHDPVMTKDGHSYDRATILEHLKHSPIDPLTRNPLSPEDLRPNRALKQACDEFLENNGWAVDW